MEMIKLATVKEEVNVSKMNGQECILPKDEFIQEYHVKEDGLSSLEA